MSGSGGNAQVTPFVRSINRFAEQKVREAIGLLGYSLPASVTAVSGSIVTVKFELNTPFTLPSVTVPLAGAEYIRMPTQVGDKGFVVPANARLGGVSGLGGGTADLSTPGNLSALVFFPIGNKGWDATDNPNQVVIYGPDGVVIRSKDKSVKVLVTNDGVEVTVPAGKTFKVDVGGNILTIDNTGGTVNGSWTVVGDVNAVNLNLTGGIFGAHGGTYTGDLKTSGGVIAGFGTADQITVQNHTHQYDRPTGANAPAQSVKPTAGT